MTLQVGPLLIHLLEVQVSRQMGLEATLSVQVVLVATSMDPWVTTSMDPWVTTSKDPLLKEQAFTAWHWGKVIVVGRPEVVVASQAYQGPHPFRHQEACLELHPYQRLDCNLEEACYLLQVVGP